MAEQVEIEVKYQGYLKKQEAQVAGMRRLETMPLPEGIIPYLGKLLFLTTPPY